MGSSRANSFRRVLFAATLTGVCSLPLLAQTTPHLKPVTTAPAALVTGIRHWSTSTYTRVAIDLGNQVQFEAARVQNPDRIYYDILNARPNFDNKRLYAEDLNDAFVKRIRNNIYLNSLSR